MKTKQVRSLLQTGNWTTILWLPENGTCLEENERKFKPLCKLLGYATSVFGPSSRVSKTRDILRTIHERILRKPSPEIQGSHSPNKMTVYTLLIRAIQITPSLLVHRLAFRKHVTSLEQYTSEFVVNPRPRFRAHTVPTR